MRQLTEQEQFWAGDFGDAYVDRNTLNKHVGSATNMWAKVVSHFNARPVSAFEIGCNIGINLCALHNLVPSLELEAVEINKKAAGVAQGNVNATIHNSSVFDFSPSKKFDLVFTCGVLIHINPELLDALYEKMYSMSQKYIFVSEYYNPTPVEVLYRGEEEKLFKRDFAGELMDKYPDLELVDYGFLYHRDPMFPKDDCTWFLLKK